MSSTVFGWQARRLSPLDGRSETCYGKTPTIEGDREVVLATTEYMS